MGKGYENPLLPHARIRQLFRAMLEQRTLAANSELIAWADICIAMAAGFRDFEAFHLVAPEASLHPALNLAVGITLPKVRRGTHVADLRHGLIANACEQLYLALGRAVTANVPVLLVVAADALTRAQWQRSLADIARLAAPLVIATLPGSRSGVLPGLSSLAAEHDLPGIPVDAADPIALYRVAGESLGRARAGGGPALIEAVRIPGSPDALTLLRKQMIARGAATERWVSALEQKVLPREPPR